MPHLGRLGGKQGRREERPEEKEKRGQREAGKHVQESFIKLERWNTRRTYRPNLERGSGRGCERGETARADRQTLGQCDQLRGAKTERSRRRPRCPSHLRPGPTTFLPAPRPLPAWASLAASAPGTEGAP